MHSLVAHMSGITVSSAITSGTNPRTAATNRALGQEFCDEACKGCFANLFHRTCAPFPPPSRVAVIAITTMRGTPTVAEATHL